MAAWREVLQQAHEHGLRHMPHAMLHLIQTYVLSAALFDSQVSGPDLRSMRSLYSSSLQKAMCGKYRQLLEVKSTVITASFVGRSTAYAAVLVKSCAGVLVSRS
jgi:hypothetical protein